MFPNTDPNIQRLGNAFSAVCNQLQNRFALDPLSHANNITIFNFSSDLASPVQIGNGTITFNAHWLEQHPTEIGQLTHELTLAFEHYPKGVPAWFADGLADYARSVYGPADDEWSLPDGVEPQQSHRQGSGIAARFLRWLELHTRLDIIDQLHHALQSGEPFSNAFGRLTHETVDHLWSRYQAQPDITPTPVQRYLMTINRKPLYPSSRANLGQYSYLSTQGFLLSNFAMQADITIVSGDNGAGFYFRDNDTNGYVVYLFANGNYQMNRVYQFHDQPGMSSFSSAIKAGLKQTNRLTVIVEKYSIYVYINGQFTTKVDDNRLLSYGRPGVIIKGTTSTFPQTRFDHIQIF